MANCNSDKNVNKTFIIEPLELTAGTPTITACTGVYTSKIIACSGDTSIEIYSGLTLNGYTLVNDTLSAVTIDASTIMSGGTNILEIVEASDTFVTGATYDTNNGILTISRNDGVDLTPSGFTSVISHTIPSGSTKTIAQNDMYLIWDDFTINSGSTLDNNGRLVVVNGDFNNFGSYSGSGSLELITTNLEYILNHGNETNGNLIFYTNSPSGWVSGDTISDISAATGNVLVTKEWVELATSVDNNDFTTGATLVGETIVFDRKDTLSAYTVDISSVNSGDTFVTGGTFSDVGDSLSLVRNDGANVVITGITNFFTTGGTYNNDTNLITFDRNDQLSAFTVNLSTIDVNDTFSTGGTYNNIADTITITRNDGDSFVISGITDYYTTGATLIGNIVYFDREDSLSAYTADLSSLDVNDTFVSGFTRSGNVLTIERNDGVDLPLDISDIVFSGGSGNCITDLYVTNINGCSPINVKDDLVVETKIVFSGTPLLDNTLTQLLVRDSSSGEVKYREANSVDTFVTGTTFSNNQLSIDLNNGTNVSALINNLSGLTVDGNVLVNGDVNIIGTATTINSEQVLIKDNIITLNSNVTGSTSPVLNAGFEVLRGSADTKSLLWLESSDMWSIDDDLSVSGYVSGTTYYGDGSNLTGIDDTFVTGGTYSGSTIVLNRNDGNSVNVTGITSDSIYTSNSTIGTGRVATLTDTLTFLGATNQDGLIIDYSGSSTTSYSKKGLKLTSADGYESSWNARTGSWTFRGNNPLTVQGNSTTDDVFQVAWNGGGLWKGGTITLGQNTYGKTEILEGGEVQITDITGVGLQHKISRGANNQLSYFYGKGFPGVAGIIFGAETKVGTEDISLQGSTLVNDKFEVQTTTDGMLMPRLTTAQMNAISSPDTHLVIFNTDLNALYRYDGSAWVAMAAGYGLISIKDSVGNPTFYSDLQTAITATTSADTVTIHSEIKLTSTVNIPARNSLTINFQGNRIYGDTSGGDFNLFTITANSSASRRDLYFIGGGVLETIGTASNVVDAAPFHALNIGTDKLKLYAGTTQIRSVNADCFYTNGMTLISGGIFYSENKGGTFGGSNILEYAKLDVYTRPTLPGLTRFCELTTRYQGFIVTQSSAITKCSIRGSVLQSGNYGLLYIYQGTDCTDNYIEQTDASGRDALYVRGSSGTDGQVSGNICINKGSAAAGNLVYGQAHNNYFYSESGYGLYVGANCREVSNNKCFSNASSAKGALFSTAEITVDNYAENLNSSNGYPALVIANQVGQTHEAFGNRAIVANNSSSNIKLSGAGTYYLANNIMGKVGTGLDLNGETNSQINTPDDFGNIKIG